MKFLVSLFISFIFVNADINVNYNKQVELQDLTYTSHYNNKECVLLDNEFKTKLLYAIQTVPEIKTELAINAVGRMLSVEIYDYKQQIIILLQHLTISECADCIGKLLD